MDNYPTRCDSTIVRGLGMGFNRRQVGVVVLAVVTLSALAGCGGGQVESDAVDTPVPIVTQPPPQITSTLPATPCAGCGVELFNASGCTGCHSTGDNKVVGPGLAGVYERASSRTSLDADGYIEQSLRDPQAFVVDGFPLVMPSFDRFSDDEVRDLIAYLKTLQ